MAGHFSGPRLYQCLSRSWWWDGMYWDPVAFANQCAECAVSGHGPRPAHPPLQPIPVQRPFQIWGINIMELPVTKKGNRYVVVLQDVFTKWPLVFPTPDQKSPRLVKLIVEELIPMFGVPEAILSDRGANLLSHLMMDICNLMGIHKLNTTAYHPQCNGMVERFNRTLKGILRAHAARFGSQWDIMLPGVLFAYRNTPHESTGEKPSFLTFGVDLRTPPDAAWMPSGSLLTTTLSDYREQLMSSLSSARELAASYIQAAQRRYKKHYDQTAKETKLKVGNWVLIRFPAESGARRKLSHP